MYPQMQYPPCSGCSQCIGLSSVHCVADYQSSFAAISVTAARVFHFVFFVEVPEVKETARNVFLKPTKLLILSEDYACASPDYPSIMLV